MQPRKATRMVQPYPAAAHGARKYVLRSAVRRSLAYADVFDYPLTLSELHRYLQGERASLEELRALVAVGIPGVVEHDGFHALAGRLCTVAERHRRQAVSAAPIRRARRYARLLKHLPFVRMVALTGSLAMENAERAGDIDVMIVAASGRVWLARAAAVALARVAKLAGDTLCPNYVIAEHALALSDTSIYGAHELAHMVPLYGHDVYLRLWASNPHIGIVLPNARPHLPAPDRLRPVPGTLKRALERLLGGALGDRLEGWERRRKVARLCRRQLSTEVVFGPDQCKGHFDRHRARALARYRARLAQLHERDMSMPDGEVVGEGERV
jgi:hypothetical protein